MPAHLINDVIGAWGVAGTSSNSDSRGFSKVGSGSRGGSEESETGRLCPHLKHIRESSPTCKPHLEQSAIGIHVPPMCATLPPGVGSEMMILSDFTDV